MTIMTLAEHLTMATSASMFHIAIDYKNEPNMKVAASNLKIKINLFFSKQRIPGIHVSIGHWKTLGDLTRTCS